MAARAPSPSSGRSSLQLPDVANGFNYQNDSHETNSPYPFNPKWTPRDPRSSSTQSLVPSEGGLEGKRTLLVIYIHGFMGNDSSFRSFPAHIHHYLKESLAETHVIHTKVYPRYKTYKSIDVARDNFSNWLLPHESATTDVVLIGHSMGGLLAAEVVLLPSDNPTYGSPFRHRILGSVSLDAPLLGLHPGIVVSGIASIFRPAATPTTVGGSQPSAATPSSPSERLSPDPSIHSEMSPPSGTSSPTPGFFPPPPGSRTSTNDPYYNPPFFNDVSFIDRGWFKNMAHFAKKHKDENLFSAATNHIMSHLEFGGCLADYPGLKSRYSKLRRLEDVDESSQPIGGRRQVRVRFVNYYTASTGVVKKPKELPARPRARTHLKPTVSRQGADGNSSDVESRASTPRISVEDYSDSERPVLQQLEPLPEPDQPMPDPEPSSQSADSNGTDVVEADPASPIAMTTPPEDQNKDFQLPPIPDPPSPPPTIDLDSFTDKDARRQAEKEVKRAKKIYEAAVKNREKAIKEREKLIEKRRRKALKDEEKRKKDELKGAQKVAQGKAKEDQKRLRKEGEELHKELDALVLDEERRLQQVMLRKEESHASATTGTSSMGEKKKERKFCMLPSKVNGVRDPAWVMIYMEGVDEVGAHCGLFFPGPHYESLVGDVGSMIVDWVQEDASSRMLPGGRFPRCLDTWSVDRRYMWLY